MEYLMFKWFKQIFCSHHYRIKTFNMGYYDFDIWYECEKCGKQKDF